MSETGTQQDGLCAPAAAEGAAAWGAVLVSHEPRLRRMVAFRMDALWAGL